MPQFRFNPRTREGCDIPHFFFGIYSNGFNPRTREGCDAQSGRKLAIADVSIHAPARGATLPEESANAGVSVSLHAPARGATPMCRITMISLCFNPRTREGCDQLMQPLPRIESVSIHAPARGATCRTGNQSRN